MLAYLAASRDFCCATGSRSESGSVMVELLYNQYLKMCLLDDDMTLTWMNYARPLIRDLRK